MNPARKQRLAVVVLLVVGVGAAVALTLVALNENINLFYTPTQLANKEAPVGKPIRVGGLVVEGSVKNDPGQLGVEFDLTDGEASVTVSFDGILPDLFREGQGIVANGRVNDAGVVVAEEVLAKHDEEYMPPEVKYALEKAGHPVDTGTSEAESDSKY